MAIGSNLFAGTQDYGVYLSTNDGKRWDAAGVQRDPYIRSLAVMGTCLFALNAGNGVNGVYVSKDSGKTWNACGMIKPGMGSIVVSGSTVFAANYYGVFGSTDSGTSWTAIGTGLPDHAVTVLGASGPNLIAGTWGQGFWKRPLSEISYLTGGSSYILEQNYPNPFNSSTTIRFANREKSYVRLTLFTELGQQIARLFEGELEAGYHDARFNGTGVASGVYFYQMQAGDFVLTKKLVLVK